jgi:hypothetical protein
LSPLLQGVQPNELVGVIRGAVGHVAIGVGAGRSSVTARALLLL